MRYTSLSSPPAAADRNQAVFVLLCIYGDVSSGCFPWRGAEASTASGRRDDKLAPENQKHELLWLLKFCCLLKDTQAEDSHIFITENQTNVRTLESLRSNLVQRLQQRDESGLNSGFRIHFGA